MFKVFVTLIVLLATSAANAESSEEAAKRLDRLKRDITQLEEKVGDRLGDKRLLQKELRKDEKKISEIAVKKREISLKISNLNRRSGSLSGEQKTLKTKIDRERKLLVKLLQEQYREGRQPRLKLLLGAQDPQLMDRMLRYYDHFSGVLQSRVQTYQSLLGRFEDNKQALSETESSLLAEKQSLDAKENELEQAYQQRLNTLASIDKVIGSEQSKLQKLQQDQKQLEQLLIELEKSLANNLIDIDTPDIKKRKGKLAWPIKGKLALKYGNQKSALSRDGIFISADSGKGVKVVHPGRVVFSEWLRGYGLLIIVDHGGGYLSLYGHNQSLLRKSGDWVQAGDTIALTGSSGGYDQTGLYFSMRHDGKSFNPLPWLLKNGNR